MTDGPSTSDAGQRASSSASIGVLASTSALSALRHRVVEFARETGGDDMVAESLELAVSELATNVIEHTSATEIRVAVHHTPSQWTLDVAGADDLDLEVELPDETALPSPDPAVSRGLFVTRSVMDSVATVAVDGHRVVRCTKRAR